MLKNEWKELFEIEEVFDTSDIAVSVSADLHKAADEALAECVNTMGSVNLTWMSEASGLSVNELIEALEGAIYQDPEGYDIHKSAEKDWMLRDQYLSGNIKIRLEAAKRLNKKYRGRFESNVLALREVMPAKVKFEEIGISIGSPWVPAAYYSDFAKEVLGLLTEPEITYSAHLGQWKVSVPANARTAVHNIYTYGTKRISALKILEHTLNASTVKIYDEVLRPERKSGVAQVLNRNETLAAQEKQNALQNSFQEWVRKDPERVKHLESIYYDTYACNAAGRFNGDFLKLPGLNPDVSLYPHQRNAVARIVLEKDVLLNHTVGSGKTYVINVGVHERKRMGLSEKNLVVVPNNVLEAFESAHRCLYPNDKILVIHPEDFKPECRQKVLETIRDGDFVAVYMVFSSFERISMSRKYKLDKKMEDIRMIRAKIASSTEMWEKKKLECIAARLSRELLEMQTEFPPDRYLAFDQLGITTLAVDEAHNFKNITLTSRADGVVGIHARGSRKCDELMEKVSFVRKQGGGVIFSTGTPLTNSISDLFVLQAFLQPEQMELLHLIHFDEWVSNFATRQTGFEVDVDSQNYRIMTRFSSFHNLPELISIFANVCDFYNGSDLGMGLPECDGYIDTVIPKSKEQCEYIDELVLRTELIRAKLVRGDEDNLLKVTHDGRAAALDIRLAEPKALPDVCGTKTYGCAKNVYECWKKYPGTSQLIFCDLGTPKKGFNIYDELKRHLVEMGIPEREIAFVHEAATDAKRRKLFAAVNRASVRILMGSTAKLGTGVNVQEHLIAIHHLDVPWKPSDMIQREGRMIRQGNTNSRVYRYRYITAGTFDAYSWQIVENKQRFISQFMSNTLADREARDLDDAVLTYAEIKALSVGDPLLKTRIETGNELERARIQCRQRDQELLRLGNILRESPQIIEHLGQKKKRLRQDRAHFIKNREKLTKYERNAFGEELLEALKGNPGKTKPRRFDCIHGFPILLPAEMAYEKPYAVIEGISGNQYDVDMREAKIPGCIQRIENVLVHLDDRIQAVEKDISRVRTQICQAREELAKGNHFTSEVSRLTEKLMDIDEELNRRAEEGAA